MHPCPVRGFCYYTQLSLTLTSPLDGPLYSGHMQWHPLALETNTPSELWENPSSEGARRNCQLPLSLEGPAHSDPRRCLMERSGLPI